VATLGVSVSPRAARAFEAEITPCYKTAPNWNASNGALVSGITPGVVAQLFAALNQARTHVMLSNVPPGGAPWATESTGRVPSINNVPFKVCVDGVICHTFQIPNSKMPLLPVEVAQGSPGFSQINMGGAYAYWSGASQVFRQYKVPITPAELQDPTLCGNACKTSSVADYLWYNVPFFVKTSDADANATYYSLAATDPWSGIITHLSYGFHQYMDGFWRVGGMTSESTTFRGMACSQVAPWAYRNWIVDTAPNIPAGTQSMKVHNYTHDVTVAAGNALWDAVYEGCRNPSSSDNAFAFLGKVVAAAVSQVAAGVIGTDFVDQTCHAAATQILNCFFQGESADGSGCTSIATAPWRNYKADPTAFGASSVSPEDIMGMSDGPKTGPWSNWTQTTLQWNGGGSTYGCYY
jgi:hypothetical protein